MERVKMADRDARRQWAILNELMKEFNASVYKLAREAAVEDIILAEELIKLEAKWVREGILKRSETLSSQMGWDASRYEDVIF